MHISTTYANARASAGSTSSLLTLPLSTSRGLFLSGLQFPYPTEIKVLTGKLTLAAANILPRQLRAGSSTLVQANKRFDLLLLPATGVAATGRCQMVLDRTSTHRGDSRRLLSSESARLVFESPSDEWSVALLAERLGMPIARLRARLFVENSGARCIIRTQRMLHAFTMLLTTDMPLARIAAASGWPNDRTLKLALRDGLLTDAERIERTQPKSAPPKSFEESLWCVSPGLLFGNGDASRASFRERNI